MLWFHYTILRLFLIFLKKYAIIFLSCKKGGLLTLKIGELIEYGVFDTAVAFPDKRRSADRLVESFELEYYISANGKSVVNGRAFELSAGTVLCGKPSQVRSSIFDFQCYYIHLVLPDNSPYQALLQSTPDYFQIIDSNAYGRLFESLIRHLLQDGYDPESDFFNARLLELFYYLRRDSQNNLNCPESFDKNRNRFIPQAIDYIRKNFAKHISLADLAQQAGYSPNHFHHVFTSVMGKTPQQYLTEARINHAKLLLVQTDNPLSEIAYECGFSSQSHFSLQFKKSTFSTPGQYRQRNIERYQA